MERGKRVDIKPIDDYAHYIKKDSSLNNKLDEIIEYLNNVNYGGEYDCAIDNHLDVLTEHNVDDICMLEICDVNGDVVTFRTYLDEFIHDYYESVIKTVCNAIETYKE